MPYALIVVGVDEFSELFLQTLTLANAIGQWSQEPGTSLGMIEVSHK